jgi:hypothetical protein
MFFVRQPKPIGALSYSNWGGGHTVSCLVYALVWPIHRFEKIFKMPSISTLQLQNKHGQHKITTMHPSQLPHLQQCDAHLLMLRCEYFSEHFVNLFSSESVCSNIELYK